MSTMYAFRPAVKFDSRRPVRRPAFAVGLYPQRPARLPIGPTEADRAWAAAMLNRDAEGVTDSEADRTSTAALTLSPGEYRSLVAEVDAELGHTGWSMGETAATVAIAEARDLDDATADMMADDASDLDRVSGVPIVGASGPHHVLYAADGTALAVVLDGIDAGALGSATVRARTLLEADGGLSRVAWIARKDGAVGLLDRDEWARDAVRFVALTPIPREVIEAGFGVKLPPERGGFALDLLAALLA